ncbi:hypothetical protein Q9R08_09830 [Microbacterium sp. QXD-8]|uniref:Uncharacterized protein n=1 Tax=Microbacterium psychrotolerans TaxID=3068321 RepID=A0ABU0Z121_9MICO|nr:hypothetical protein [Microbacterium sp. QXD-8]MDQ7878270.1 hypothetical protein [Microbacterium sp. QXD-8]
MIDPDDERTALSRRAVPKPADDVPDDRTLPARRRRAGTPDAATPADGDLDVTAVSARSLIPPDSDLTTQAATMSAPAGPRRSGHGAADIDELTATVLRRPTGAAGAPASPTAPAGTPEPRARVASAPRADATSYRARPIPPTMATRAEPARSAPQAYVDTAAAQAAGRRRRRRRVIVAAVAASVLVVVVAVSLAALLTAG